MGRLPTATVDAGEMHPTKKRRRAPEARREDLDDDEEEGDPSVLGFQALPVAELPLGFDGIPMDGAQYLAVVR